MWCSTSILGDLRLTRGLLFVDVWLQREGRRPSRGKVRSMSLKTEDCSGRTAAITITKFATSSRCSKIQVLERQTSNSLLQCCCRPNATDDLTARGRTPAYAPHGRFLVSATIDGSLRCMHEGKRLVLIDDCSLDFPQILIQSCNSTFETKTE
jgi:hypothetical protein